MTSQELRQSFLDFFREKGHTIVPSAPVIPHGDPTLYFTNAGMNQFKDVFLGTGNRDYTRAADTQKCIRASGKHNDLEDVGHDTYHHTFFEMLGNWSFGDYYKKEAIAWAWELLTKVWGLDPTRLHVTVYRADDGSEQDQEAAEIWAQQPGIDPSHIHWFGAKDNFWEMGETGPCGPCSEIHYDRTPDLSGGPLVNAGVPEVIEIWNLVFIQFNRDADKVLHDLPARHVDTGMGFERICAVMQEKASNYDTDVFSPILDRIGEIAGRKYEGTMEGKEDIAMRVIADHIRTLSFAIADGAAPGNAGRGYVLRRILRRAVKYAFIDLNVKEPLLYRLVSVLADTMGSVFPEIVKQREYVERIVKAEEESFLITIGNGMKEFTVRATKSEAIAWIKAINSNPSLIENGGSAYFFVAFSARQSLEVQKLFMAGTSEYFQHLSQFEWNRLDSLLNTNRHLTTSAGVRAVLSGEDAFFLYDTSGFPLDLTELMTRERGMAVDVEGFNALMEEQKRRAREARKSVSQQATDIRIEGATEFVGYSVEEADGHILEVIEGGVALDRTPFYAEMGGQLADTGHIVIGGESYSVHNVHKVGDVFIHLLEEELDAAKGTPVRAEIDRDRRAAIERNHSATHLLHEALRRVLGDHVQQAGSLVAPDHLRFDFNHFGRLSDEEIREVEGMVNAKVREGITVVAEEMAFDEARKIPNVKMFFGDKYGSRVRVVTIDPAFSREFCGGTHVLNTAEIGLLKLTSEGGIQAGVRRVNAITGTTADELLMRRYAEIDRLSRLLNVSDRDLYEKVEALLEEKKGLEKELAKERQAGAEQGLDSLDVTDRDGVKLISGRVSVPDIEALKELGDKLRERLAKLGGGVGLLGTEMEGKAMLVCVVTDDLTKRFPAGKVVSAAAKKLGGGGGGKPHMATAGAKDLDRLDETLGTIDALVAEVEQG